jgi:uncharacterized membrane protein YqiK
MGSMTRRIKRFGKSPFQKRLEAAEKKQRAEDAKLEAKAEKKRTRAMAELDEATGVETLLPTIVKR